LDVERSSFPIHPSPHPPTIRIHKSAVTGYNTRMSKLKSALSGLGRRTAEPPISWLMKIALDRPKLISLAAGFTDNPSLPVEQTREILDRILGCSKRGPSALQYGTGAGDALLRELTVERLRGQDNAPAGSVAHDAGRLVITHGSQQFLHMVGEALFDSGDIVLVEDPTYFVYLGIAQSRGMQCRGVRMESDGIDVAHLGETLERLKQSGELSRVKALYLVSYHQNPTGTTTSLAKKAAALKLLAEYERAAGHPIYLMEDAAYRELRFAGDDPASALTLPGAEERVIYSGTYSKPFATGIRVGFGLAPKEVFAVTMRIKGNHDFGTSNLPQQILREAIDSGLYEDHVQTLRKRYGRKAKAMLGALEKHCAGLAEWATPCGGLNVWARFPRKTPTGLKSRMFEETLNRDVLYVPGQLCYADDPSRRKPNREMRLSFGAASEARIREGIRRLGEAARATQNGR